MEFTDADLKVLMNAFYRRIEDFVADTGRFPGRDAKEDMMADALSTTPLPSKLSRPAMSRILLDLEETRRGGGPASK